MNFANENEMIEDAHLYTYTLDEYQDDVVVTLGPDADARSLALGVGGEAGEVLELIKKGHRPGREVDVKRLSEEIGDVMWYLAALADHYDLDLGTIAEENIDKLSKRYPTNGS